ncbi:MAG: hypothetical protein ACYC2R_13365, partial [Burkholderiales bacterium]
KAVELQTGQGQRILAAMEVQLAKAQALAATAEADEKAFYAAPVIDKTDAVSVLQDQLICSTLFALDAAATPVAQQELLAGGKPRWALALQRYREILPLPTAWEATIETAWTASCDKANPEGAATVAERLEVARWLRHATGALMAVAPQRAGSLSGYLQTH